MPLPSFVISSLPASNLLPAISVGVFSGNASASASGAVPTTPMTEVDATCIGRGPSFNSMT
ncbi:hypothetical protein [Pseudoalteromonas sp. MMG012]|uniref:hypothetical protein n=1 Tax=Pseudoalteromonas sp. MMG012 TaxID=2822686 RepID=UPI001FFD87FE|nr:hypothetical protein [Pseudoalteromonas sp. MMG012]